MYKFDLYFHRGMNEWMHLCCCREKISDPLTSFLSMCLFLRATWNLSAISCEGPELPENTFPRIHQCSAIWFGPKWTSWYGSKLIDAAAAMAEANFGNKQPQFTIIPASTESKAGSTLTATVSLCSAAPKLYAFESAANIAYYTSTITDEPGSDEPISTTTDAATPTAANSNKSTTAISKDAESCRTEICWFNRLTTRCDRAGCDNNRCC